MDDQDEEFEAAPEKKADDIANAGREHRQGQAVETMDEDHEDDPTDVFETEGDVVLEHTVQRPPETYFHTLLEQEGERGWSWVGWAGS